MFAWTAVLKILGVFINPSRWDKLLFWLLGQAPRVFGGKYGAYVHGRKTRAWFYPKWKHEDDQAPGTPGLWDDAGVEFIDGFLLYSVESKTVVLQLEQALSDLANDNTQQAKYRIAEAIQALKVPT